MEFIDIKGNLRETVGKKDTKKLRKADNIPCVLYGGKDIIHFHAHENEFRNLVYTPNIYLVKLSVNGKEYNTIMKDIQFHPVTDKILHIDFYEYSGDKKLMIEIPVILEGIAEGIQEGGKMQLEKRKLFVKAFPKDLPDNITVNINNIKLGESLKVGELEFNDLELLDHPNSVVVSVKLTRAAKGMDLEEEVEEEVEEVEEVEEGKDDKDKKDTPEAKEEEQPEGKGKRKGKRKNK